MNRYFEPISLTEFKERVGEHNLKDLYYLLKKDLSKVKFDIENLDAEECEMLPNGMPFMPCFGGGDWESSVCFIVYFDGKKLRGYIPEAGNVYNGITKCAYGSNYKKDLEDLRKRYPHDTYLKLDSPEIDNYVEHDMGLIIQDIMGRIFPRISKKSDKVKTVKVKKLSDYSDDELINELQKRLRRKPNVKF